MILIEVSQAVAFEIPDLAGSGTPVVHRGVLAHSTHLRGAGTYDPATRNEDFRVRVTLATGIPEDVVRRANLHYLSPESVDLDALRADPDTLVVDNAGEVLFRLRS